MELMNHSYQSVTIVAFSVMQFNPSSGNTSTVSSHNATCKRSVLNMTLLKYADSRVFLL
jgi:hypothetical protein